MHKKPPKRLTDYKKATKLEEGLTLARKKGELKFKKSKKGLELSFREHLGKIIDNIGPYVEVSAVLGMTLIVHNIVASDPEVKPKVDVLMQAEKWIFLPSIAFVEWLGARLGTEIMKGLAGPIPAQYFDWILSFVVAYMLVKYGGQLIGLLGDTFKLSSLLLMFL
jgi:hypothetical protein